MIRLRGVAQDRERLLYYLRFLSVRRPRTTALSSASVGPRIAAGLATYRWVPPSEVIEVAFLGWGRHELLRDTRLLNVRENKVAHAVL